MSKATGICAPGYSHRLTPGPDHVTSLVWNTSVTALAFSRGYAFIAEMCEVSLIWPGSAWSVTSLACALFSLQPQKHVLQPRTCPVLLGLHCHSIYFSTYPQYPNPTCLSDSSQRPTPLKPPLIPQADWRAHSSGSLLYPTSTVCVSCLLGCVFTGQVVLKDSDHICLLPYFWRLA